MTSTDMTVLSGGYPEVCYEMRAMQPKSACTSTRWRVITIEASATVRDAYVPVVSLSIVFIFASSCRVYKSPSSVKHTIGRGRWLAVGGLPVVLPPAPADAARRRARAAPRAALEIKGEAQRRARRKRGRRGRKKVRPRGSRRGAPLK